MKGMELNVDFAPQEHRLERFKSTRKLPREVLFEFHLKFWNTASIGIPVRSLL